MASRLLVLLVAVVLMAGNCKCRRTDDPVLDYYLRMWFQNSGRDLEKRDSPDTTTSIAPIIVTQKIDDSVFDEMDVSQYDDNAKKPKRPHLTPFHVSEVYSTGPQQELFDHMAGVTRNGPWPCYYKYLIQ